MRNIRPVIDFRFAGIAEDVMRLRDLLQTGLRLIGRDAWPAPSILNIACGRADETGILLETLSPHGGGSYLGLDLRAAEIAEASQRWQGSAHGMDSIAFREADASLARHWPGGGCFDFIFIRHQNFWDAPAVWDAIFRNALAALKENGLLLFTSYFDREHELAHAALLSIDAIHLLDLPHTRSRSLPDAPGKSVDKRLAIYAAPDAIPNRSGTLLL